MRARAVAAAPLAVGLTGCEGIQAMLDPHGVGASRIADLWWLMFALGIAVWFVTVGLAVYVLYVKRDPPSDRPIAERTQGDGTRVLWVAGGTVLSLIILLVVFIASLLTGRAIQAMAKEEPLTIEVIGHRWWWEVRYDDPVPARRFETANEIHIPVGEPVRIKLRSNDVIHSFWVPNLTGKLDLLPARTNTLWIEAEEPGVYRGQCAHFCGLQHANMAFMVVAHPPEEYRAWALRQLEPAGPPPTEDARRGQEVFLSRGCVLCHTVRGTMAHADVGPDLTHFGSRLTIAAGILPNTRGHLGGWIGNPQAIKPGNFMPRVQLESEELQALLTYLESLE